MKRTISCLCQMSSCFYVAALSFMFSLLLTLGSCQDPHQLRTAIETVDEENGQVVFQAADCPTLFPVQKPFEHEITDGVITTGETGFELTFSLESIPHYRFGALSNSCACVYELDFIHLEGIDLSGLNSISYTFLFPDGTEKSETISVNNGLIDLDYADLEPQFEGILTITLYFGSTDPAGTTLRMGGLAIVINIDSAGGDGKNEIE